MSTGSGYQRLSAGGRVPDGARLSSGGRIPDGARISDGARVSAVPPPGGSS